MESLIFILKHGKSPFLNWKLTQMGKSASPRGNITHKWCSVHCHAWLASLLPQLCQTDALRGTLPSTPWNGYGSKSLNQKEQNSILSRAQKAINCPPQKVQSWASSSSLLRNDGPLRNFCRQWPCETSLSAAALAASNWTFLHPWGASARRHPNS